MFHIKLAGDRNNKNLKVSMPCGTVALNHSANLLAGDAGFEPTTVFYDDTVIPNVNLRCICFLGTITGFEPVSQSSLVTVLYH